jgi:hypothetical protein
MKRKQRIVRHLTENGHKLVNVPLDDRAKRYAILFEQDYQNLIDLGLSPRWRIKNDRGAKRVMVWNRATGYEVAVARLIVGAGAKQSVTYANGNPFDLRAINLVVGLGRGLRNDRNDIRASKNAMTSNLFRHEYVTNGIHT